MKDTTSVPRPSVEIDSGRSADKARSAAALPAIFMISLMFPIPFWVGSIALLPHRVMLLAVFVPLLIRFLKGGAGRLLWADGLLIFSTLWAVIALVVSGGGAATEAAGIFVLEFFGAYLLARVCIRSQADFRRLMKVSFWAVVIIVPFAIVESVTHRPILLELIPGSIGPSFQAPRYGLRRAQAVFAHPILFGVFASSFFGLFLFGLVGRRRLVGVILTAAGTVVSLSTGALISLVLQVGLVGWEVSLRSIRKRWTVFAVLCVVGYFVLDLIVERSPFHTLVQYASFSTRSAYNRIHIWNYGVLNVAENPLFGLGLGIDGWKRAPWMSKSADNFWLLLAMTYGLPMITSFVAAVVLIVRALSRAELPSSEDQRYRAGLLVSLGGIIVAGGTVHYWHTMMALVMFMFGAGLWVATGGATPEGPLATAPSKPTRDMKFTRFRG